MPRARFQSVDYSSVFADLYKGQTDKAKAQADDAQAAADSNAYDLWQNDQLSDDAWLAYIAGRLAATANDPDKVSEHQKWVELQRQVQTKQTKEGKAAAKAQQDATDADTYDQWKNGLISDDEWLAYLDKRAGETVNDEDPKVHEQWVELQRQYRTSIADNQAQAAYDSGSMSAASYIAYLRQSLVGLDPGSSVYRDRQAQITKIVDTTLANDTQAQATEIINGIPNGKHSYEELLKLYKDAYSKAREGTDLKNQLSGKISEVQQQITQRDSQGALERIQYLFNANKISGKEAGKQVRAIADKYFKGDTAKYYQVLEGALQFEKYPGLYNQGTAKQQAKGHGGSGGGTKSNLTATRNTINVLKANISRAIDITDQYLNNGDAAIIDPGTGKALPRDVKTIHGLQVQTLNSYDQLIHAYESTGRATDAKQAADWAKRKTDFIQKAIQPVNTIGPAQQTQHLMSSISAHILNTAKTTNDPNEVLRAAAEDGQKIINYAKSLTTSIKVTPVSEDLMGQAKPTSTPRPASSQPLPQLVSELNAAGTALVTMSQPGATPEQTQAALDFLKKTTGTFIPDSALTPVIKAVGQQNEIYTGLQTGTKVLYAGPNGLGVIGVKDVTVPPAAVGGAWTTQRVPDVNVDPKKGQDLTHIYMDVNGTPTDVWAVQQSIKSPYKVWVAQTTVHIQSGNNVYTFSKGQVIPSALIGAAAPAKNAGKSNEEAGATWNELVQAGMVGQDNADLGWVAIQTPTYVDNGKQYGSQVWVGDPVTGTWYIGSPAIKPELNADGTVRIGDDGKPATIAKPSGTAGAVPMPYIGSDPKTMQGIWNAGLGAGAGGQMAIDATGAIVPAATDHYSTAYYDPSLAASARSNKANAEASGTLDSNWWDQGIQDLKVSRTRQTETLAFRDSTENKNRGSEFGPQSLTSSLKAIADSVGIKFGAGAGSQAGGGVEATATLPVPTPKPASTLAGGTTAPKVVPISQPTKTTAGVGAIPLPTTPVATSSTKVSLGAPPTPTASTAKISVPPPVKSTPTTLKAGAGAGTSGSTAGVSSSTSANLGGTTTKTTSTPAPAPVKSGPNRAA